MKNVFIILFLIISTLILSCQENKSKEMFDKSMNTKDTAEIKRLREEIAKESPDSEYGLYCRAWLLSLQNDNIKAYELYTKAIEKNRELVIAYYDRSIAAYMMRDYNKTISDLTKAIDLTGGTTDYYYRRGLVYERILHDYSKAIDDYLDAIRKNPKDKNMYVILGNVWEKSGDLSSAIGNYTKAIEIDPYFSDAYIFRGLAYAEGNNRSQACKDMRKAYSLGDTDAKEWIKKYCK